MSICLACKFHFKHNPPLSSSLSLSLARACCLLSRSHSSLLSYHAHFLFVFCFLFFYFLHTLLEIVLSLFFGIRNNTKSYLISLLYPVVAISLSLSHSYATLIEVFTWTFLLFCSTATDERTLESTSTIDKAKLQSSPRHI